MPISQAISINYLKMLLYDDTLALASASCNIVVWKLIPQTWWDIRNSLTALKCIL